MSKTVAPQISTTCDSPEQPRESARKSGAVTWLAGQLGVSRQHVNQLLLAGRIVGAFKSPAGVWMLAPYGYSVIRGSRGPRMRPLSGARQAARGRAAS